MAPCGRQAGPTAALDKYNINCFLKYEVDLI
jgi:hypothetical protein